MKNKELTLRFRKYNVNPVEKELELIVNPPEKLTYADLFIQLANMPLGEKGVGNIQQQRQRLNILDKMEALKVGDDIKLEQREIDVLKEIRPHWVLGIVDKGLIEFQEELDEELKK